MLVYGDPQYQERLSRVLARMRDRAAITQPDCLEELRALVIQTGQLEQGVQDRWPAPTSAQRRLVSKIAELTDSAAAAFYNAWARVASAPPAPAEHRSDPATLLHQLEQVQLPDDTTLTIKVPEGFEFYALFPEQYCASALQWATERSSTWPRQAAVAGIRSIGTTLSAMVKMALIAAGWRAERFTVRPAGPPFARRVEVNPAVLQSAKCALIVDEGPGISGSSMAAVAQALAQAGIRDLSFFPGHEGEPGSAASPEVRRWWAKTPRYLAPLENLRWNGLSLGECLAAKSSELLQNFIGADSGNLFPQIEDLSAGLWRTQAFSNEIDWPAVSATFERTKYLCSAHSGSAILWRFSGFGCALDGGQTSIELALKQMAARAVENLVPAPLGSFRGFLAVPWIAGTRLTQSDASNPAVLNHLGRYLVRVAGPPLPPAESQAAVSRLAEVLYWNTREALGASLAAMSTSWADAACFGPPGPTYGDGRMAPHEWVQTPAGAILKTDSAGHDLDHTLIGKQSVLWDLAGLLVEWDLPEPRATPLLCHLREAGIEVNPDALIFYQLAYAAFRLGLVSLASSQPNADPDEQSRLQSAFAYYRNKLRLFLSTSPQRASDPN